MARFSYNSVTIIEPHSANVPERSVKTEDLEGRWSGSTASWAESIKDEKGDRYDTIYLAALLTGKLAPYRGTREGNAQVGDGLGLGLCLCVHPDLKKPISREYTLSCAKNGSPLLILQDNGMVYSPISESMPAVGQNERLLPFAGKRVTASGKLFTRGGSHALVIEKIDEARSGK